MMDSSDCFKIEMELKQKAMKQAKAEGCSRASLYRRLLIEYLNKVEKK